MKVVLFCGGLGLRIRDAENVPKPLVQIGYRPVLWHVMKYYAHYGHKDFILCLGYGADAIKKYFLDYSECTSNDFVLSCGEKRVELVNSDIDDWKITFVDTGINANIGQRLKAVEPYLENEEEFLANYSDGLTDLQLPAQLQHFREQSKVACQGRSKRRPLGRRKREPFAVRGLEGISGQEGRWSVAEAAFLPRGALAGRVRSQD